MLGERLLGGRGGQSGSEVLMTALRGADIEAVWAEVSRHAALAAFYLPVLVNRFAPGERLRATLHDPDDARLAVGGINTVGDHVDFAVGNAKRRNRL